MTLSTKIAVHEPTDLRAVWAVANGLIGSDRQPLVRTGKPPALHNPPGIGLPAWLWLFHGADGPLLDPPHPDDDDDARRWRENSPTSNGWAAFYIDYDTGYAYREPNGAGCRDLHAWLIRELGAWLTDRGLTWQWQDEFTGEWHPSTDTAALAAFGDADLGALPNLSGDRSGAPA